MEVLFSVLIFVVPFYFIIKYKSRFIYAYLVFNIIIDVSLGFIEVEMQLVAISRALISLLFIFIVYVDSKGKLFHGSFIILVYLIYLLVLVPFSSNILVSFSSYLKVVLTISMFPLGLFYFDSIIKLRKLNVAVIWVMFFIFVNFLFANVFGIGSNPYGGGIEFYVGNIKLSAINTPVYALLILTSIFQVNGKNHKKWSVIFAIPSLIFLILSLKRISLVALAFGILIILFYSRHKSKYIKWALIIFVIIISLSPFYIDILEQQIEARGQRLNIEIIEKESRYFETLNVIEEIIYGRDIKKTLFGKEIFNSVGFYASRFSNRPLHVDYNILLYGTGTIGVFLYLLVYLTIFFQFRKIKNRLLKNVSNYQGKEIYYILMPLFYAIFWGTLIISISGGMLGITHRTLSFLYMGAIIGILKSGSAKVSLSRLKLK